MLPGDVDSLLDTAPADIVIRKPTAILYIP